MRYNSDSLDRLWSHGLTDIGLFEPACAAYVARYTDKNKNSQHSGIWIMI